MLDLQVYGKEVPKINRVILSLEKDGNTVTVVAVDEKGDRVHRGSILEFLSDGTINLLSRVSEDIGFKLDKDGKIIERIML